MFRIARLLNIAKPCINTNFPIFVPSTLFSKNLACFTETPQLKIAEMIEDENLITKLDAFAQQISLLDASIKQQVIDAVVQKITEGQLLPTIVQHEKIREQFEKYPNQYFKVYYYRIQQSIEKLKQLMEYEQNRIIKIFAKEISDSFVICFDILKKLQGKDAIFKELQLLHTFADYNFRYLSELVEVEKCKQVMNKSKQSYRLLLSKFIQAINKLKEDENNFRKELDANLTEEKKINIQNQLKLIQQTKQLWVEEYAEVVQEMINNEQELQQQRKEKAKQANNNSSRSKQSLQIDFLLNDEILSLEPYIQKAVKNYQIVPNIYIQSVYLYKFKKLLIQIGNQKQVRILFNSRMNPKERQLRLKQLEQQMKSKLQALNAEGQNALKMMSNNEKLTEQHLANFIMDVIQTNTQRFVEDQQNEQSFNLSQLGKEIQKLANYISNESLRKKVLGLIVRMAKEEFGIKVERFLQKIPRSARTQRRNRNQYQQ